MGLFQVDKKQTLLTVIVITGTNLILGPFIMYEIWFTNLSVKYKYAK